jgi:asparagine synthase (glutamine-hydrolysing)
VGVDSGSSNGENVVGLSGGFDSRSVAACFQRQNIPFVAVTRLDAWGRCAPDASVARQLAHALGLDWRLIHLKPARGRDLLQLLRLKGGLNYLGMAFIVPCFEELRQNYGPQMLYFTGEGGNTVPRDLRAPWELRGLDETVNTLLTRHQKISIEDVALLTKISREDIVAEIKGLIETYPEDTWCQRYVHFFVSEKSFKLTFEAEDRNRCFFWSMAPFFALQFVKYAMECPDHQKERLALYRQFLMSLSPIASSIAHANLKVAMDGYGFVISQRIRSIVDRYPTSLRRWLSGLTKARPNGPDGYYMCINEQIRNASALENYLDCGVLSRIVSQSSSNEVQNLLTITSVIEQFESNNITVSKYYEMEFS